MIYLGIAAGIVVLEWLIKGYVEKHREESEEKAVLGGKLLLRKYHNEGAFLNLGEKVSPVVAAISVIFTALIVAVFFISFGHKGSRMLKTGLALLLGGGFSNTYDRLTRKYVVDYVSFGVKWKKLRSVVFNIADFCIMIGALLLVLGQNTKVE